MIITRTPFRISFFGGGTDFPEWYQINGGAVLSTSIDKYCYVSCRKLPPFFEHKHRIAYSKLEFVNRNEDIEHPAIRGILEDYNIVDGLEVHCDADLPARSGLGSSSAFAVGLVHALQSLYGKDVSKRWLVEEGIRIERDVLGENVGVQDQSAVAMGGFNKISFLKDGHKLFEPLMIDHSRTSELESRLMLFFTGFSRYSTEITASTIQNIHKKFRNLERMASMVDLGIEILESNTSIDEFGKLLHEAWEEKKSLSDKVSNREIDKIYDTSINAGAIGGKVLGAGGGGFILLFVPLDYQNNVKRALSHLVHVPFKFENTGSTIIYS